MTKKINYPPKEILPSRLKNKYEFIILWMLKNNEFCTWADFHNSLESYEGISNATLSKYIKELIKNDSIVKEKRNTYKITIKGKNKLKEIELGKEKQLIFPSNEIIHLRDDEINIFFMIIHNNNCRWENFPIDENKLNELRKFSKPNFIINQKKLWEILKYFEEQGYLEKQGGIKPIYRITERGYKAYLDKLKDFNLDRESLLEEEAKRIQEIKEKTNKFLKERRINDEHLAYRLMDNLLNIPLEKKDLKISEEIFLKILLYISWNHPDNYDNFITTEKFSEKFNIDKLTLEYHLREIIEKKEPKIFFKLKYKYWDDIYYFRENEKLEKNIRAILEDSLKKAILFDTNPNLSTYRILKEICNVKNLINKNLKSALRPFVKEYVKFLEDKIIKHRQIIGVTRKIKDFKLKLLGFKKYKEDLINESKKKKRHRLYYGSLVIIEPKEPLFLNRDIEKEKEIESIDEDLKIRPYDINLYIRKSKILCDVLFRFKDALKVVQEGLNIDDKEISLYINKAMILRNLGEYDDALKTIEQAHLLDPQNDVVLSKMSYILYEMGDLKNAQDFIEKAIRLNTNNLYYFTLKAEILIDLTNYVEALEYIDYALVLNSNDTYSYQLMARTYGILNVYEGALDSIEKAISLDQEDPYSFQIKAESLELSGNLNMALSAINNAIDLNPADHYSYQIEARILGTMGKIKESLNIIDIAIDLKPEDYYSHHIKAEHLRRLGYYEQASDEIEQSLLLNSNDSESLEIKALIRLNLRDYEIALDAINKAIELDHYNFTFFQIKAEILRNLKRCDIALDIIKKSIELEPKSPYNYWIKAQIKFELEENKEALEIIEKAIEYDSNLAKEQRTTSYQIKANILSELGRFNEALEATEKAINLDPKNMMNYNDKALYLAKIDEKDKSIQLIQNLIRWVPNEGLFIDTYGEILILFQDFPQAIEVFKRAIDNLEKNDEYECLHESYIKIGESFKELRQYNKGINYLKRGKNLAKKRNWGKMLKRAEKLLKEIEDLNVN